MSVCTLYCNIVHTVCKFSSHVCCTYVRTCNQHTYVCTCMKCIDSGVHELVHKCATIVLYLYVHKIVVTHWRLGSATHSMTQSCLLMWEALYIPTHFPQQVHTCTHMLSSPLCVHAYSLRTKLRIQTCMCIWLQEHHCRCTVHTHVHMYTCTLHIKPNADLSLSEHWGRLCIHVQNTSTNTADNGVVLCSSLSSTPHALVYMGFHALLL